MSKTLIRAIALLLCALIVLGVAVTAFADETADGNVIAINSLEEFLAFAESCRLDSYSQGNHYELQTDIDLTGTGFVGIPIFSGTFDGGGHTISGLSVTGAGSDQGLFRYLTDTAVVRDLKVTGAVEPDGTRSQVGGIVGVNAGTLENCSFDGQVSGAENVGGLVGRNEVSGNIVSCTVSGSIHGDHFVGGIAGENLGTITGCENNAQINTTEKQNSVDISDITLGSLTGSESVVTVTDVGGIAGNSSGSITGCVNRGNVGYQYIGYNIGGIAGSQNGYIAGCVNYGRVYGRKEVGGIVGQMEPYATISFETDTLQILKAQMDDLSVLIKRATANAENNTENIGKLTAQLEQYVADAQNALDELTPNEEDPQLKDLQTTLSLLETVTTSIQGVATTVDSLYAAVKNTGSTLTSDLKAVSDQMDVINSTLDNASSNLGGSALDVSDSDTDEDRTAKVEGCVNYGDVLGDLNVGGIAGAMSVENDLDPEEDVEILGDSTLNYAVDVRIVIRNCRNEGKIQVRKLRGGGIAGWMAMGLVRDCVNTGELSGGSADHVGGIAGYSQGYIRSCDVKCTISGDDYVGGIAGEAVTVTDCRTMICLTSGKERLGAILGYAEDRDGITGNHYLSVEQDLGGIDGVSYDGCAQKLEREEFLALEDLEEIFRTVVLHFVQEDGTVTDVTLELGQSLSEADVPAVPEKAGYAGRWEGLEPEDLVEITFDSVYQAAYTAVSTVIGSQQTSESGLPVLMAQGQFQPGAVMTLEKLTDALPKTDVIETWAFTFPEDATVTAVRYLLPEGYDAEKVQILLQDANGCWREEAFTVSGSYLVVQLREGDSALCLAKAPVNYVLIIAIAGAACVTAAVVTTVLLLRRRKKK